MEFFTIASLVLILVCVTYLLECARKSFEKYNDETKKFSWGRYKFKISEIEAKHTESNKDSNLQPSNTVTRFKGPFQNIKYKNPSTDPVIIDPGQTNLYECTPSKPKECKLSDATSCMGCKNLTARCVHLKEDTDYTDTETGQEFKLAKSKTLDDGYCLSVKKVVDLCNPNHGKLALVLYNRDLDEEAYNEPEDENQIFYNLLCVCTEPGYVGNLGLLGSCEDPFVCNGKVVDINVPLTEMVCECGDNFEFMRINGLPTCQIKSIDNMTPTTEPIVPGSVSKQRYHKTIAANYTGESLPNPCRVCPVTGLVVDGAIIAGKDGSVQCQTYSQHYGVPIRRFKDERLLAGDEGPDAILAISNYTVDVYGYLEDTTYPTLGINFTRDDNKEFFDALKIDKDEYTLLIRPYHQVKFPGNFKITDRLYKVPNLKLYEYTWTYDFKLQNPAPESSGFVQYLDPYTFNLMYDMLSMYYLWGRTSYYTVMNLKPFVVLKKVNGLSVYSNNKNLAKINDETMKLRFLFFRFDFSMDRSLVMLTAENRYDWDKYHALRIKEGECGGRIVRGECIDPFGV
ncbi:Orf55 [Heliothis zea nudivirus]|uniref:Orf55 n=1 Tax=Heliothis zea nudivirus 1 TaxID=3116536 RepID=Q8JKQ6_9VIRU|nr:Orf55 [Heliothis zea nudivirus]AAN04349.1 Orf55 [Heliothis zea nudivirus]